MNIIVHVMCGVVKSRREKKKLRCKGETTDNEARRSEYVSNVHSLSLYTFVHIAQLAMSGKSIWLVIIAV